MTLNSMDYFLIIADLSDYFFPTYSVQRMEGQNFIRLVIQMTFHVYIFEKASISQSVMRIFFAMKGTVLHTKNVQLNM